MDYKCSVYSKKFWVELACFDQNIVIWDLTTNPIWDKHRTSKVVWISEAPFVLEEFHDRYLKAIKEEKLQLTLWNWNNISLDPLGVWQKVKDVLKFSPILAELQELPDDSILDVSSKNLIKHGIVRWLTYEPKNGWRVWFGRYTDDIYRDFTS